MRKRLAALTALAGVWLGSGSPAAHHSLAQFDLAVPVLVKGTVVRFDRVNPHTLIHLDQTTADGRTQRWVVDGPTLRRLTWMRLPVEFLAAGDVVEVCGFPMRDGAAAQRAFDKFSAHVISGHIIETHDGSRWFWSDYGQLDRCLEPGETRADIRTQW